MHDAHGSHIAFSDGLTVKELAFDDYAEAESFLSWLKLKHPIAIKNGRLGVNVGALLQPVINWDGLSAEPVKDSIGEPGPAPAISSCSKLAGD